MKAARKPDAAADREATFWRKVSPFADARGAYPPSSALAAVPPTHLVVLGLPHAAADIAAAMKSHRIRIFCFGSLVSRADVATGLGRLSTGSRISRGACQQRKPSQRSSASGREREAEEPLEPYVPYGLLVQDALDAFLPGDERDGAEAI